MLYFILIIFIIFGLIAYFALTKPKNLKENNVYIRVETPALQKDKTSSPEKIIEEAEALFKNLQAKQPYSPLPYKVLAEFYIQKKIFNEAINKYSQMIKYLNHELNLEKLTDCLIFLKDQNQTELANKITTFYGDHRVKY